MVYSNTRPDSPKGRVYSAFQSGGDRAAEKKGEALGLPESKVRRWLTQWADDGPAPASPPARVAPKGGAKGPGKGLPPPDDARALARHRDESRKRNLAAQWERGDRVCMTFNTRMRGTITEAGPQQSVVKWEGGNTTQCFPNDHFMRDPKR